MLDTLATLITVHTLVLGANNSFELKEQPINYGKVDKTDPTKYPL